MRHRKRQSQISSIGYRALALLLALLLVLPFVEVPNHAAEDIVIVKTDREPAEAHPVYVIAVPRQEKLPPQPLDLPIISSRNIPAGRPTEADLQLPFPMSSDQAVRIGNGLIEDAEFEMALRYFQEAQKQETEKQQPPSLEVLNGLAHCYYGLKRDEESLEIYKQVLTKNPDLWQAQFNVGRIHLENGRYGEAVETLNIALKLKPDDLATLTSFGIALTKQGRSSDAILHLTRVVNADRHITEPFYNLAEAYAASRQWLKAAETFKSGADVRGKDPNGYFYWGVMLFNDDKVDEAFEAFQKVRRVDITATHFGVAFYMAEIYRLRGNLQDALAQYQLALKLKPDDVESLFQAGYLSFKLGQRDQAKELFRKLMQVNPLHAGGAANWAALEATENEVRKSRKEKTPGITLRNAAEANPTSAEAHINLGAQLITEEIYPEAVTALEKAVNLKPDLPAAQYNLGLSQLKVGDFEKSASSTSKALKLKPNWPDALNNLGLAYSALKRWDEAAKVFQQAVDIVPTYSGAYFNLGIAFLRLGQIEVAKQLVEKLKPMSWKHQAELAHQILAVEQGRRVAISRPTPSPSFVAPVPEPSPSPINATPDSTEPKAAQAPPVAPAETECPEPLYRQSSVTQMASIVGPLEVPYTDEARQNKVEGKIVLQVVLCANGRVADITVDEGLPFGLTERAIEAMRKVQFQPAIKESRRVTVITKQEFTCAQGTCTAVVSR